MTKPLRAWAALIALCSTAAGATTLLALDVPALSRGADAIVRGQVVGVASRWTGDHQRIVTEVQIEVADRLKGAVPQKLTVVQPGGVVGDIGQRVSGVASFVEGEEVVVFLERRPGGTFLVEGMAQGKFRIERSSDGKVAYAVPEPVGDALLLDPVTRQPAPPAPARRPPTLEELVAQIDAALKGALAQPPGPTGRTPPVEKVP